MSRTPADAAGAAVGKQTLTMALPPVQRKAAAGGAAEAADAGGGAQAAKPAPASGGGEPLGEPVRAKMERAFGVDFSAVRVHEGTHASALGALGYTQGNDIHFAPGQYQPETTAGQELLGHELAHVVQQSQGRVAATGQAKGVELNDDPGLEREADEQGARAARGEVAPGSPAGPVDAGAAAIQRKVIQRKDVPTHFGTFRTTKFDKYNNNKGVACILEFHPDENKIDAKKIGLSQTAKITRPDGSHTGIDPTKEGRRVTAGGGKDYTLDRISTKNNPIYGANDLPEGDGLDKTRQDNNLTSDPTTVGPTPTGNTMYQLGYAFTDGVAKKKKEAALSDRPTGSGDNTFETAALGLEGTDKDKYFGSVKWGYKLKPSDVDLEDIELASMGVPTQNFLAPVELWNTSKQQGTLEVIADPATAKDAASNNAEVDLAKGTKARQLSTVSFGGVPYVKVEKLAVNGSGTGQEYFVRVVDLKDIQDGKSTVAAPSVKVAINPVQAALYSNPERTLKVKDLPQRTRMRDTGAFALDPQRDHQRIERLAHELYEKRGKQGGSQDADWFQAEAILKGSHGVEIADGPDTGVTGYVDHTTVTPE